MNPFMLIFLCGMVASQASPKEQTETKPTPDGYKTRKCEFPNISILKIHTRNGFKFCSASLVSLRNVVTSAKCLPADVKYVEVFLGGSSLDRMSQRILVNQSAIHLHPQNKQPLTAAKLPWNDVAFVTLPELVKVDYCIKPIQLASDTDTFYPLCITAGWKKSSGTVNQNYSLNCQHRFLQFSGWSSWLAMLTIALKSIDLTWVDDKFSSEHGRITEDLEWGNVALISEDKCRIVAPHLHDDQICGGTLRKGNNQMCQMDVGSALMCWRLFDNHLVLVGLSSSDVGCDYGIKTFTQLSKFLAYDDDDYGENDHDGNNNYNSNDDDEKKTSKS